jgi:hypothetical protein
VDASLLSENPLVTTRITRFLAPANTIAVYRSQARVFGGVSDGKSCARRHEAIGLQALAAGSGFLDSGLAGRRLRAHDQI